MLAIVQINVRVSNIQQRWTSSGLGLREHSEVTAFCKESRVLCSHLLPKKVSTLGLLLYN